MIFLEDCLLEFSFIGGLGGGIGGFYFSYLLVNTLLVFMTNFFSYVFNFSGSLSPFSLGFRLAVVRDFFANVASLAGFSSISSKSSPYSSNSSS
jgi:hypothetical protein